MNIRELDINYLTTIESAEAYLIENRYSFSSNNLLNTSITYENSFQYYVISPREWRESGLNSVYSNSLEGIVIYGDVFSNEMAMLIYYEDDLAATLDINEKTLQWRNNLILSDVQDNVGLLITNQE